MTVAACTAELETPWMRRANNSPCQRPANTRCDPGEGSIGEIDARLTLHLKRQLASPSRGFFVSTTRPSTSEESPLAILAA